MNKESKPLNEIRVGMNSRVKNVIKYCESILKENKVRDLHFSAVGGAIGKLLDTVEVLRISYPDLYQVNNIGSVSYRTMDSDNKILNEKLYPKLEVTLSLDEPKTKTEGFQDRILEEERLKLLNLLNSQQRTRDHQNTDYEGRQRRFNGSRGGATSRGGFFPKPLRGGFREDSISGFRGGPRGGFRGRQRGGFRSEFGAGPRGGFRSEFGAGPRGGFRSEFGAGPIGGFRGRPRGGFRGGRGGPRGGPRGGFRGPRDQEYY